VSEATSSHTGIQRLVRLRLRLTIWYVGTFGLIILLLGTSLFAVIRYQISQQLDNSLTSATEEIARLIRITYLVDAHIDHDRARFDEFGRDESGPANRGHENIRLAGNHRQVTSL